MPAPVIALEHVHFAYGHVPVLEDVSLTVGPGEFVALVGPNGSGKSTLIRIALGLLTPRRGTARLFGEEPGSRHHRGRLGFVPQRPSLADGIAATVEDIAASGRLARTGWIGRRGNGHRAAVEAALDAVDLLELRREPVATLSGGQQQRTFIARALATQPEVLVLDEPIAGVDIESQETFRKSLSELVRQQGGSVLLVSHELGAVADDLDRIVVLKRSVRFDGPPADLVGTGVSLGVHDSDLPVWLEGVD